MSSARLSRTLGWRALVLPGVAVPLLWCFSAQAQDLNGDQRARPGMYRVGAPQAGTPGKLTLAAGVSGGISEGLSSGDAAHGRVAGNGAISLDALSFLNLGAHLNGRYDVHPRDAYGKDAGFLVEPELSARLSTRAGSIGLAAELVGFLPGGPDVETSFSGASVDGKVLLRAPVGTAIIAAYAGYRIDRTALGAGQVQHLRRGDRAALGMSEFDAVLLGVGGAYPIGTNLVFGEVTTQALLGSPKLAASPTHVTLGLRHQLGTPGLSAELVLDTLLSARPDTPPGEPLFPIEPRATLRFGLSYRFGEKPPATAPTVSKPSQEPAVTIVPAPPAPAPAANVELALTDERGQPLSRAKVIITRAAPSDADRDAIGPLTEAAPGLYRIDHLPSGRLHVHIDADGFRSIDRDLDVSAGEPLRLEVRAELATPPGQVRGLVRSYAGKPLAATVRIEPGDAKVTTDAEGFFQLDVAPGQYQVVIEAVGYAPQRRTAKVEQQGVVIVNADLARAGASSP